MTKEKELFYEECGKILGVNHDFVVPYHAHKYANRWTNRNPGNGRYPGFGVVQMFGSNCIHIAITSPQKLTTTAKSQAEALELLRSIVGTNTIIEKLGSSVDPTIIASDPQ
jgi:hypothetical protein